MTYVSRFLPPRFIRDCLECDCDIGDVTPIGHKMLVRATAEQYAELRNRAEYYVDQYGPDAGDGGGLKRAAKALLRAMDAISEAVQS